MDSRDHKLREAATWKVFELQAFLISQDADHEVLAESRPWLQPYHFDQVLEERFNNGHCGYPACGHGGRIDKRWFSSGPDEPRIRIDTKSKKIYEVGASKYYCCEACHVAAATYRASLDTSNVLSRPIVDSLEIKGKESIDDILEILSTVTSDPLETSNGTEEGSDLPAAGTDAGNDGSTGTGSPYSAAPTGPPPAYSNATFSNSGRISDDYIRDTRARLEKAKRLQFTKPEEALRLQQERETRQRQQQQQPTPSSQQFFANIDKKVAERVASNSKASIKKAILQELVQERTGAQIAEVPTRADPHNYADVSTHGPLMTSVEEGGLLPRAMKKKMLTEKAAREEALLSAQSRHIKGRGEGSDSDLTELHPTLRPTFHTPVKLKYAPTTNPTATSSAGGSPDADYQGKPKPSPAVLAGIRYSHVEQEWEEGDSEQQSSPQQQSMASMEGTAQRQQLPPHIIRAQLEKEKDKPKPRFQPHLPIGTITKTVSAGNGSPNAVGSGANASGNAKAHSTNIDIGTIGAANTTSLSSQQRLFNTATTQKAAEGTSDASKRLPQLQPTQANAAITEVPLLMQPPNNSNSSEISNSTNIASSATSSVTASITSTSASSAAHQKAGNSTSNTSSNTNSPSKSLNGARGESSDLPTLRTATAGSAGGLPTDSYMWMDATGTTHTGQGASPRGSTQLPAPNADNDEEDEEGGGSGVDPPEHYGDWYAKTAPVKYPPGRAKEVLWPTQDSVTTDEVRMSGNPERVPKGSRLPRMTEDASQQLHQSTVSKDEAANLLNELTLALAPNKKKPGAGSSSSSVGLNLNAPRLTAVRALLHNADKDESLFLEGEDNDDDDDDDDDDGLFLEDNEA